ncbi:stage II sporulation protein R [Keratinibaculum paraultunense]|nr:stage II sporulation protein R [Keratinibaculum paraultunense]QQY79905.1 stage II sporulation protein R [Keratinibaculum paraultunense]
MKHKRLTLCLVLLVISAVYLIYPYASKKDKDEESFKDEIIRFHIKANSNKEEDQALKLKIRDEILKKMGDKFANSRSIEETRYIILNNIDNIKSISEDLIAKEGKDFSVDVSLGNRKFPTRKYGNIIFPAGEYETLMVSIGEGKGQNWWCVMFPPLCFVEISHGNTSNPEKVLGKVLSEEEVYKLQANKELEEPPIILKSKIIEVFGKTKNNIVNKFLRNIEATTSKN